VKLLAIGQSVI